MYKKQGFLITAIVLILILITFYIIYIEEALKKILIEKESNLIDIIENKTLQILTYIITQNLNKYDLLENKEISLVVYVDKKVEINCSLRIVQIMEMADKLVVKTVGRLLVNNWSKGIIKSFDVALP